MKKFLTLCLSLSIIGTSFSFGAPTFAAAPTFNTTGEYVVALEYLGFDYTHDMTLVQDTLGHLTGSGNSPAGSNTYPWTISTGTVSTNTIAFTADYTPLPGELFPPLSLAVIGTIAVDGSMAGTWSNAYSGGVRTGTWMTTSGNATQTVPTMTASSTLAADDFGVVSYDSGLGILAGYTAGFSLTGATFENAQSVVVELFAGNTRLQRNTATAKVGIDIVGSQISTPFDVSGTFDYVTDGYWVNTRESEYGQSQPATKVVATVTLENGQVVSATNTTLTGDPQTIYPTSGNATNTVTVTIEKFVQGRPANATSSANADFPMTASFNASNTGSGSGAYVLSETNTIPYQAVTTAMTKGANYSTAEVLDGDLVGTLCSEGKPFALQGYTTGNTRAEAVAASSSLMMPSFTNLQQNKYVIVWNRDCTLLEGEVGGDDATLAVTSIEMVDSSATANGSFADGWKYVFHITTPSSEPYLAMKFADWVATAGSGIIPVAGNMRISSLQADNGGTTILLTAANTYSTPALHMTSDLDPSTAGLQIEITVEVAVPTNTPDGSYTTNYGIQSNP